MDYYILEPLIRTTSRGAAVECEITLPGNYRVRGRFARATDVRNAGNGVNVVVARILATSGVLFSSTIGANHVVVPADPMSGSNATEFNLEVELTGGDRLHFVVYSDDAGRDGTFDGTVLEFEVVGPGGDVVAAWPGRCAKGL